MHLTTSQSPKDHVCNSAPSEKWKNMRLRRALFSLMKWYLWGSVIGSPSLIAPQFGEHRLHPSQAPTDLFQHGGACPPPSECYTFRRCYSPSPPSLMLFRAHYKCFAEDLGPCTRTPGPQELLSKY